MRIGQIDRRIVIQVRAKAQDAAGEEIYTWSDAMTIWAGRRDVTFRDSERYAASPKIAEIDTVFTIRYAPGNTIRADLHRIKDSGRIYDIHSIAEIGRHHGFEIMATARAEESLSEN